MSWITSRVVHSIMQIDSLDAIKLTGAVKRLSAKEPGGEIKGVQSLEIAGRRGFVIDLNEIDKAQRYVLRLRQDRRVI